METFLHIDNGLAVRARRPAEPMTLHDVDGAVGDYLVQTDAAIYKAVLDPLWDIFGEDKLVFGSDWPNGLPQHTWKSALAVFTQAIGAQPIDVREQLLGGTAARVYRLAATGGMILP